MKIEDQIVWQLLTRARTPTVAPLVAVSLFHRALIFEDGRHGISNCCLFAFYQKNKGALLGTLYPCTITITQDGKSLAGAMVTLYTESSEDRRWPPGGTTNDQR
jgi:hypothetical protein